MEIKRRANSRTRIRISQNNKPKPVKNQINHSKLDSKVKDFLFLAKEKIIQLSNEVSKLRREQNEMDNLQELNKQQTDNLQIKVSNLQNNLTLLNSRNDQLKEVHQKLKEELSDLKKTMDLTNGQIMNLKKSLNISETGYEEKTKTKKREINKENEDLEQKIKIERKRQAEYKMKLKKQKTKLLRLDDVIYQNQSVDYQRNNELEEEVKILEDIIQKY